MSSARESRFGIGGALLLMLPIRFFLAGVSTVDPTTIGSVSWFPVRRASRVDDVERASWPATVAFSHRFRIAVQSRP